MDLPLSTFLAGEDEKSIQRSYVKYVIANIVTKFDFLIGVPAEGLLPDADYRAERCKKIGVVNLGVLRENPASLDGMLKVMKDLHQYIPRCA